MLMNNLDPDIAEHPDELIVYGGGGKAARNWAAYDAIVASLRELGPEETLLVQSGKPVGVFRTHEWAPRVLIANANLVPQWATWEEFRRLDALGLTMFGQMTAGSSIYIGTQGILQGTYETFAAVAQKRHGGSLAGTITLTAGPGGMGGAQPMAVTMNGGVVLCVEVDPSRIQRRLDTGYLDVVADGVDDALKKAMEAKRSRQALSIGVLGNAADIVPHLLAIGAEIDVVTDQTSAHDPLMYVPRGVTVDEMPDLRAKHALDDDEWEALGEHGAGEKPRRVPRPLLRRCHDLCRRRHQGKPQDAPAGFGRRRRGDRDGERDRDAVDESPPHATRDHEVRLVHDEWRVQRRWESLCGASLDVRRLRLLDLERRHQLDLESAPTAARRHAEPRPRGSSGFVLVLDGVRRRRGMDLASGFRRVCHVHHRRWQEVDL
jgi:hypothetical protein